MSKETVKNYANPLLEEQENAGASEEKVGGYVNPASKARESRKDIATKMSCKCETNSSEEE